MSKARILLLALVLVPLIAYATNVGLGGPAIFVPKISTASLATCTSAIESLVVYDDDTNTLKLCRNTVGVTYEWEEFVEEGSCVALQGSCTLASQCCDVGTGATCPSSSCCIPTKTTGVTPTGCVINADCCYAGANCSSGSCCIPNGFTGCAGDAGSCCDGTDTCAVNTCNTGGGGGCSTSCSSDFDCYTAPSPCTMVCGFSGLCDGL